MTMVRYGNPPDKWTKPKLVQGNWKASNRFFEEDPDKGYVKKVQEFISDYHYSNDYNDGDDNSDNYNTNHFDNSDNNDNYNNNGNNYNDYQDGYEDDYYGGGYLDQGDCHTILLSEMNANVLHCEYNIQRGDD